MNTNTIDERTFTVVRIAADGVRTVVEAVEPDPHFTTEQRRAYAALVRSESAFLDPRPGVVYVVEGDC